MTVMPGKTVGIIGGGQLGRMMCLAAKAMGYRVAVLDPTPGCPCAQVADVEITAAYGDAPAVAKLAEISDVVTYEFENIDCAALEYLEKHAYLPQGRKALEVSRHRLREKTAVAEMGIPVAGFRRVDGAADLRENVFYPSVLKTATGGYDGKGQAVLKTPGDLAAAQEVAESGECVLEDLIPFSMEISVIVARGTSGFVSVFPVAENVHVNGILHTTVAPARISDELAGRATDYALRIAEGLGSVGVIAVEMFVVPSACGGEIIVNEIAPRPHNSGHFSMDACVTGQFEQHVRSVCGLPPGDVRQHSDAVMVNILGEHLGGGSVRDLSPFLPLLNVSKLHLYGRTRRRPAERWDTLTCSARLPTVFD